MHAANQVLDRDCAVLFHGGALRANLDVAQVKKRIEIANYEKAIQDIKTGRFAA